MVSSTHSLFVASRLTAHDVSVGYGKKSIIKDVNIVIYDDEFSVIIGPNGCGKSNLLKIFSRIMQPQSGEIRVDGNDVFYAKPKWVARQLSLLAQGAVITEPLTIYKLVFHAVVILINLFYYSSE